MLSPLSIPHGLMRGRRRRSREGDDAARGGKTGDEERSPAANGWSERRGEAG